MFVVLIVNLTGYGESEVKTYEYYYKIIFLLKRTDPTKGGRWEVLEK
jgi:hypothetical protein